MHRVVLLAADDSIAEIIAPDGEHSAEALLLYKGLLDQLARRSLLAAAIDHPIQLRPPSIQWTYGEMGDNSSRRFNEAIECLFSYSLKGRGPDGRWVSRPIASFKWSYSKASPDGWVAHVSFPKSLAEFLLHRVIQKANWIADEIFPQMALSIRPRDPGLEQLIMKPVRH